MKLYTMRKVGNCFAGVVDVLIGIGAMVLVLVAIALWAGDQNAESGCESGEISQQIVNFN